MRRAALFIVLASSSACAGLVGFEDLRFDGVVTTEGDGPEVDGASIDGLVEGSPPGDGGGPDGDGGDGRVDADGAVNPRLREITFEQGNLVGGLTGTDFVTASNSVVLATPGLRGLHAADFSGDLAYADNSVPKQPPDLYVTFRFRVNAINAAKPDDTQIMRVFSGVTSTVNIRIVGQRLSLSSGAATSASMSGNITGLGADLRIGIHTHAGAPGLAELFVTSSSATSFGSPVATLATEIGNPSNVTVGSATIAGGRYSATIDDILLDSAALPIP